MIGLSFTSQHQVSEWLFLKFDKRFKECGVRYNSSRERIFIKLVGVPVSKEDFQARFPKRAEEDLPIEPEM